MTGRLWTARTGVHDNLDTEPPEKGGSLVETPFGGTL